MNNVVVVLTSKNNYKLLDKLWLPNSSISSVPVINVDVGSSAENIRRGKDLCAKHDIIFVELGDPSMQHCMAAACERAKSLGAKFIIYFHQDSWPYRPEFWAEFDCFVGSGLVDRFGTIGFNCLSTDALRNYHSDIKKLKRGKTPIGIIGRTTKGLHWIGGFQTKKIKAIPVAKYRSPFAVEITAYFAIAININLFESLIVPDRSFGLFFAFDDLSYQFLERNTYNLVLPNWYILHRPDLKPSIGMPRSITKEAVSEAMSGKVKIAPKWGDHQEAWYNKWGWYWKYPKTISKAIGKYTGTLIHRFYYHDNYRGPLKVFKLGTNNG